MTTSTDRMRPSPHFISLNFNTVNHNTHATGSDVDLVAELLKRLRPFPEEFSTLIAELEQFERDCAAAVKSKRRLKTEQ